MRIMVVEDESLVAEVLQRGLEALGNHCIVVENATQAHAVLESEKVDAVTLDLGLPGRGGLALLEMLAADRPELARHTLVITGQFLDAESASCLARCGAGVLAKPFTMKSLEEAYRTQMAHTDLPRGSD